MNRGVVRTSPVQQMVAAGGPNWYTRPPPHHPNFLAAPPNNHFVHQLTPPLSVSPPSWNDDSQELPESWSQLLLGGMVSEEDKGSMGINFLNQRSSDVKQENINSHNYGFLENNELSSNMLNFSHKFPAGKPNPSFHECNSNGIGGPATKKPRIQPPSVQSTFKVRKEKLGDRITALHQLVSPFGKTDTASVLLEAMGYIRFLQSQIEALSLPYLGTGSTNPTHLHPFQLERNCLFPEEPGQLLNEECIKRKSLSQQKSGEEPKKDLRSRGLCLVPISCMLQVGNDNAADYWAPAFGRNF